MFYYSTVIIVLFVCVIACTTAEFQNFWRGNPDSERHGNDTRKSIIWCTVSRAEQRKCIQLALAVDRDQLRVGHDSYKIECKHAFNKDECMILLDEEKVTLTSLDPGQVFIGGRFHSLVPIAQEIADGGFNFQYAVAAIRRNSLPDVTSIHDLRGKRACFAGVGTLAGWILPIHTLMKTAGLEIIDCNNHVKSATNFFGPSCAVNALAEKFNPIGDNSDKLCQLCIGKVPGGKCTDADPYANFEGAFRCLVEIGEIAFLRHNTIEEMTRPQSEFANVPKNSFELLCKDGSRRPLEEYRNCNWGKVPTNAIVTSSASSFELRERYQRVLNRLVSLYGVDRRNGTATAFEPGRNFEDTFENERNRNLDRRPPPNDFYRNRNRRSVHGVETKTNEQVRNQRQTFDNYGRYGTPGSRQQGGNINQGDLKSDPDFRGSLEETDPDRNRQLINSDGTDAFGRDPGPYGKDPFSRDPYSINRDQYGENIDPYVTNVEPYHKDRDRDHVNRQYNDSYYDDFDRRNVSLHESFYLFGSQRFGDQTNLLFLDSTRSFRALNEQEQTYTGYLNENMELIMGVRDCPVNSMTLCVTSDQEMEKCIKMRTALKAQLLKPEMVCHKGHSQIHCMQAIQSGNADVTVLDASDVYTAGLNFELIPFISEVYNLDDPEYYVVAVAKEEDPDTELTYLKGKNTCHGGINTAAGWVYPLAYLTSNGWIRPYGCNSVRAAAEYFSKSCVPGALSTEYNTGVPYDNMCHLCHGASFRYCRRDASEDYYGHTGAFRCLVEGGGHVAFVKHTTVNENTGGKRREWWARDALVDDFELLCPDGTRAEINDYRKCNLGRVRSNAIVTRGGYGYNETQLNAYINLFLYSQTFYGKKIPDEFSFSMFYSTPPYSDLIFQDATTQLRIIPPEQRYYSTYVGKDFMRARRIVDCQAGAATIKPMLASVLTYSALIATFTRLF